MLLCAIFVSGEEYTFSADDAGAYAVGEAYGDFLDGVDPQIRDSFDSLLPDGSITDGNFGAELAEKLDLRLWIRKIADFALSGINESVRSALPLFSIVLLMALSHALLPVNNALCTSFLSYAQLLCAVEIFRMTSHVLDSARSYMKSLCSIMNLFLPVMERVWLMGGSLTEKSVSGGAVILLSTVLGNFTDLILTPTVSLLFTFTAVSAACPDSRLGGMVSGIRRLVGRLWSILGILFSFLLSVQTLLASAADSLGARTVRFALASFIPGGGGMLAEALSTIRTGVSYIRHGAGAGGIIVLAAVFLPAVIPPLMYRLAVSLTASAADILGVGSVSGMLGEVRGIVELIIGAVTAASLLFLIALIMFMKVQG